MPRPLRDLTTNANRPLTAQEAFGIVLRAHRLKLGLKQSDLENDEYLDHSYISKLELAKREVGLNAFIHIANKLGISAATLMEEVVTRMSDTSTNE